jgi:anti-sigma factor RsiW
MNCRDVTPLLSAERDGPLDATAREALERHVAACPACKGLRADMAEAASAWKTETARAATPDPAGEWRSLRARLHAEADNPSPTTERRMPVWWLAGGAASLTAAAVWLTTLTPGPVAPVNSTQPVSVVALARPSQAQPAGADYVDTPADTTPVVYLDQESGWLIVWAESPAPPVSG